MKINGSISTGNVITLATVLLTFALGYGKLQVSTKNVAKELDKKADRELVEIKLEYIQRDLNEIKSMLKEEKWQKK
ncbi:MAG TPA: hypothetical protein DG048_18780 [Pseudoalteromonas sp.]|jgi:hypothetical protein|nr:hypothetical protein [Pseudoalteromonas sp.]|tara:strand:+ start:61 stop:288 length:228 start_codon:yes stop_codon:yes gene_type:complete